MEGEHKWVDQITKDLNRQYPFHEMFSQRGGHGQQDLFRILKAYSIHNPRDGYCQGQAPVAAVLLMHMPVEVITCLFYQRSIQEKSVSVTRDWWCIFGLKFLRSKKQTSF